MHPKIGNAKVSKNIKLAIIFTTMIQKLNSKFIGLSFTSFVIFSMCLPTVAVAEYKEFSKSLREQKDIYYKHNYSL